MKSKNSKVETCPLCFRNIEEAVVVTVGRTKEKMVKDEVREVSRQGWIVGWRILEGSKRMELLCSSAV